MSKEKYIIMPIRSLSASRAIRFNSSESVTALTSMANTMHYKIDNPKSLAADKASISPEITVVDSLHEDGAKLVEMNPADVMNFKAEKPGLKVIPLNWFKPMWNIPEVKAKPKMSKAVAVRPKIKITFMGSDGKPVRKALVVAFTDVEERVGADGTTNSKGEVSLDLGASKKKIELLLVIPRERYWGIAKRNFQLTSSAFELKQIDLNYIDCVQYFHAQLPNGTGRGVKVGVVDTGCGPHIDLLITGGRNTTGEPMDAYEDNGEYHGTHVAGIIAGKRRGLAKDVKLYSYRVFRKGDKGASNWAIAKAIDTAVADGCDIINLSLGGGGADDLTKAAIEDARMMGSVCVIAAGNEGGPVAYPAAFQLAIAVSAIGRKGTFPKGSSEESDVGKPIGKDKNIFFASFSNHGPEIDVAGPGVGVVSTVPGDEYASMSGTSMACPAISGVAARLLSENEAVLKQPRDESRSDAIARIIFQSAAILDLGQFYEGHGLPGKL